MTTGDPTVTTETIAAAAALAELPLAPERVAAVAGLLGAWLPAVNVLNARMQAEELRGLMPATTFTGSAVPRGRDAV
jgi:hypothetical protein